MSSLPRLFAGGVIALLALDYIAAAPGSGVDFLDSGLAAAPMNVVNREHKSDRLPTATTQRDESDTVIATVEIIGLRDAAVVYRSRDGRVLFRTDPLANGTVVAKGVTLPEVTIRDTRKTNVATVPAVKETSPSAPAQAASQEQKARDPKVLEGCDAAFSPLASARANFSTRCLASNESVTQIASAIP